MYKDVKGNYFLLKFLSHLKENVLVYKVIYVYHLGIHILHNKQFKDLRIIDSKILYIRSYFQERINIF